MGGGGGGGGEEEMEVEVALSTGALEAMWREDGLRPVLQLADEPRMAGDPGAAEAGRYRVALSDGGTLLHPGLLAASLNHLVARGDLRRGTVIRVLEYFAGLVPNRRVIIVIQLEILQAECTLVRSPTIFEADASQHIGVSCPGGLAIHEPCFMPCTQQVISNSSSSPDKRVLDSSVTPKAESTVINLPFDETAQCTVDAKMQQLTLNDNRNQRFMATATGLSGAMVAWLTPGAVVAVSEHGDGNGTLQPVLQVVDIRMVSNVKNPSTERFQMVLSDGIYTMQSMLATSLNSLLRDGSIKNGSIIHLQEFTCSTNQFHRIIIVTKLYVLQSECNIMGNPKPYEMRNQPNEQVTNLLPNAAQAITGITPVSALNPYQNIWTIKARVTAKTDLRHYKNDKGGGKLCSFDLLDGQGGEIRVTCFNAQADQFFDLIEVDKVYLISRGSVRPAQKKFNSLNHEYEITLDFTSSIEACVDDDSNIPRQQYNFRQISEIENVVQSNLQQPSLNSHQNPRFAVPSMAGGSGGPGNTYGQPAESFCQQPPPGHMNRAPVSKNDVSCLVPVAKLNPYHQNTWTIKARVTAKTDLRHYKNDKCAGKVFSFDLLDGPGGEIRVTCFNAQADQFFDLIEVDKVYLISRGSVRPAQKKFNSLNHEYEITLDFTSSIEACVDDDSNIPRQQHNFRQISEIENIEAGAIVDLIGIVTSVGPSAIVMRKDGTQTQKRTLQLKDMSVRIMEIILWGKFCDAEGHQLQLLCDSGSNPILSLKGGRVSDFNGRTVVTISSTQLKVNPDLPVAERLKQWYITEGKNIACISLSREISNMSRNYVLKTIAQIMDENLGRLDKPDFITVRAVISRVGADFCYQACTLELNGNRCYKKVTRNADGTLYCDRCDQRTENCEYRYLLPCQIKDQTGAVYATVFQEVGEAIFGHTAQELFMIRNVEKDVTRFNEIMKAVLWREYLFKLKVYVETYNDEQRVKCTIIGIEKLEETNKLLKDVSCPILKDDLSDTPNVGSANLEAGQSMLTSSNANLQLDRASYSSSMLTSSGAGATGFAHSNWMPTPPSASSDGCDFNGGFGLLGQSAVRAACFKCNQPGHWSKDCLV